MPRYHLILWTDNRGVAHARHIEGNRQETYACLQLIAQKYGDGEGFNNPHFLELPSAEYLADVQLEVTGEVY